VYSIGSTNTANTQGTCLAPLLATVQDTLVSMSKPTTATASTVARRLALPGRPLLAASAVTLTGHHPRADLTRGGSGAEGPACVKIIGSPLLPVRAFPANVRACLAGRICKMHRHLVQKPRVRTLAFMWSQSSFTYPINRIRGVHHAARMRDMPATVVSTTLAEPLDWPDATAVRGDAVEVVARLRRESRVPLRSHGSLSMNRALMAAGLVDRVQVTLFPVVTGQTGLEPIFRGAADFDLELIETRTLDGDIQELTYRPTLHA
jgi:dihydrofolate reductase